MPPEVKATAEKAKQLHNNQVPDDLPPGHRVQHRRGVDQGDNQRLGSDLIWGAQGIADEIGLDLRQVYYLLAKKRLPHRKLSHRVIVASKTELRAALIAQANESAGGE